MDDRIDPDIKKEFKKEALRYTTDKSPGFFRQKVGKKFTYYDTDGKRITDKATRKRIDGLGIPPAWKNVWICPSANGHLQATGSDDRGRTQYLYHPDWIKISQQNKFSKLVDFGLSLPKIRQKVKYDLTIKKLEKRKIIATIIWLLEHTFIRIGNEEYSKENDSYGLTTLRNRHVSVKGSHVEFRFRGKSGVFQDLEIRNPTVAKTIKHCTELPGFELFQYVDEDGARHVVDSEDVNLFLKDVTQDDFSTKDFRTWGATNLSANSLYKLGPAQDKKTTKQNVTQTVKKVAEHLNNTVSVCRNYYIHPAIISTYEDDILIPHFENYSKSKTVKRGLSWDERALINLLQKYPS